MLKQLFATAILALSIAACGPASTPAQAPTPAAPTQTPRPTVALPTPTPTLATPAPASTQPSSTVTPAVKGQDCGTVVIGGALVTKDTDALQAENCMARSYQQCTTATLVVRLMGVDAGVTHTFMVEKQGAQCALSDSAQTYVIPTRIQNARLYTCESLSQSAQGLVFKACGEEGDIVVPAPR